MGRRIAKLREPMVRFAARFCSITTVNPPGDRESTRVASMVGTSRIYAEVARRLPADTASGRKGRR